MMNEPESDLVPAERKPLSPLQLFAAKIAIVTLAILVLLFFASQFLVSTIENELALLKGGPPFWETIERKLYRLADEPDLPPEKKQKILTALRKLSTKYKPYLDAIGGENIAGEPRR